MKIVLLKLLAGPNGVMRPGEHDIERELAERLVDSGAAIAVEKEGVFARARAKKTATKTPKTEKAVN